MTIEPAPDVTLAPEGTPAGRGSKGKIIAAVAAVVVLLAGVLVTVKLVSSRSADGGASSPDEAVENMIGSLEENDLLGVLDMFAPWERDAAKGLLEDYLDNAQDAGYVADDADLSNVGGYTLTVDGLEVQSTEVNERIANVALVGGTAHFTTEFDELPLGAEALEQLEEATGGEDPEDVDTSGDLADLDLPPITTIEDDGRWYVSLFYTIAESARAAADAPAPTTEGAVPAVGADSPEEAVDEMISAIERVDVERMIELTPPDEMGVLHDYAPLFLDELEPFEGGSVDFHDAEYRVEDVDGGRKVIPTHFVVDATGDFDTTTVTYDRTDDRVSLLVDQDGSATEVALVQLDGGTGFDVDGPGLDLSGQVLEADGGTLAIDVNGTVDGEDLSAKLTATPDGDCILVSGDATSGGETEPIAEQLCPEDFSEEGLSFAGSPVALADVLDNMGELVQFDNFSRLFDLGIVTVEVDGDWYVSPLRSTTELVGTFAALAEGI